MHKLFSCWLFNILKKLLKNISLFLECFIPQLVMLMMAGTPIWTVKGKILKTRKLLLRCRFIFSRNDKRSKQKQKCGKTLFK